MLVAAVAMVLAAACGGDDDQREIPTTGPGATETAAASPTQQDVKRYDPGASDTEIKVGSCQAFSGPAAAYGTFGKTIEAYFKMVNERGGVNGRQIRFIAYDDQFSPDKTVQCARTLVEEDKVLLLFATLGTPTNSAIWDYMNQQKVPHLFLGTGASKWGADPKSRPWTMGWLPSYHVETAIYAEYLQRVRPTAKVAVLYQNDDLGKDYMEGLRRALGEKFKDVVVGEATYAATDASVNAQVIRLKESGADTFFVVATPKFAIQAFVTASQIGWKPQFILASIANSIPSVIKPVIDQAGLAAVSDVVTSFYLKDPGDPAWAADEGMKAYFEFMRNYYPSGDPKDVFNVSGYTVATALVEGVLRRAGNDLTRANVLKQATSIRDLRIETLLPGILVNTSSEDYYPLEAMQLAKYNPSAMKWDLFGEVVDTSKK